MSSEFFSVPDLQHFSEAIGIEPTVTESEAFELDLAPVTEDSVIFTFSPVGRSVRIIWKQAGGARIDIYREGATRLWIAEEGNETSLCTEFSMGSTRGTLSLRVFPTLALKDELLSC